MSLPYSTAPHAWRFVLILHRLASLEPDQPIRITSSPNTSINTARSKLFQGRNFISITHDPALARYNNLALAAVIQTLPTRLEVHKAAGFDYEYSQLRPDTFTNIYRAVNAELLKSSKTFGFPFGEGVNLTNPQVKALKDFLTHAPLVKYVNVTPNSIMVTR